MPSFEHHITDDIGLHARPAAEFVRAASGFAADVRVTLGDRVADAKSLLEVLQLQAGSGATIVVSAEGEDAEAAIAALAEVLGGH